MSAPEGGVVITLADIYRQLVGLTARVDVAIGKVDGAIEHQTDHEARLRSLERSRWPIASVSTLIALASLLVAILVTVYGRR